MTTKALLIKALITALALLALLFGALSLASSAEATYDCAAHYSPQDYWSYRSCMLGWSTMWNDGMRMLGYHMSPSYRSPLPSLNDQLCSTELQTAKGTWTHPLSEPDFMKGCSGAQQDLQSTPNWH